MWGKREGGREVYMHNFFSLPGKVSKIFHLPF